VELDLSERAIVIPFTNPHSGLRDYRVSAIASDPAPRWPRILALVVVAFLAGLALGVAR
jgi:hypothetical protein